MSQSPTTPPSPDIVFEDPEAPAYDEDGVDLTLIRWMLSLSPAERLQVAQESAESLLRMRREAARSRAVR